MANELDPNLSKILGIRFRKISVFIYSLFFLEGDDVSIEQIEKDKVDIDSMNQFSTPNIDDPNRMTTVDAVDKKNHMNTLPM